MITQQTVNIAPNGTAWKTAKMRGYVFKTALSAEIYGQGAYKLTFREAANDNGNPVDYDFYFNVDDDVLTAYNTEHSTSYTADDATTLILSKELLLHVLTATWTAGTAADYETVRDGGGTW